MNRKYETLENERIDINSLSKREQEFLKKVTKYYSKKPDWNIFSNYWLREGQKLWAKIPRREVVDLPVFQICLDLEMRLGIEQGHTRLPDYRDKLEELIDKEFASRYQFCKKTGISQDTLSRILNKRRNSSIQLLQSLLDTLGYEISFSKKQLR